jgi:NAD-dependent DNA ligase
MFNNMTFGLTGHVNRDELEKCIKNGGGQVTGVVGKKVSFLVCDRAAYQESTQRVRKAKKFGTVIVTPDFVYDSAYSNTLQSVTKYTLYDGKSEDDEDLL